MRKDFKTGGRVGLSRGGGSAPFLRGRSGASNIKAPRGEAGWKQMQQAEAKIGRAVKKPYITETRTIGTTKAPVSYTKSRWKNWKKTKSQQAQRKQAHVESGKQRLQAKYPGFKFKNKGGKV